jgi:uncharacterized repeat protein (TIGR01451 family)
MAGRSHNMSKLAGIALLALAAGAAAQTPTPAAQPGRAEPPSGTSLGRLVPGTAPPPTVARQVVPGSLPSAARRAGYDARPRTPAGARGTSRLRRLAMFGKLPLAFVPAADAKSFVAQGPGYTLTLRSPEAVLALGKGRRFGMRLEEARAVAPRGANRQASFSNEYVGGDRRRWRTHVPNYGEVDFRQVYPGIGLRYYGAQGQLEADFLVAPGADPARIRLSFPGSGAPRLDAASGLRVGAVRLGRPRAYQTIHGRRRAVSARYVLQGRRAAIRLGAYDHTRALVIDPTLSYSYNAPGGYSTLTGLGRAFGLYVDASGDPVLVASAGDTCGNLSDALDMYCTVAIWKFNPQGTQVLWRSTFGGPNGEYEFASGTDPNGDIYIGGSTDAPSGFPTTAGVVQETPSSSGIRSYVAKFGPDGTLLYSTLLGSGDMELYAVTGDASGDAYVAGSDKVSDLDVPPINSLPVPCGGSAGSCYTGFVEELNPTATDYLYGTYFGGPGLSGGNNNKPYYLIIGTIAVDSQGHIYIGGQNLGFPDLPTVNAFESSCQPSQPNFCDTGFLAELNPAVGGTGGLMFSDYLLGFPQALALDNASPPNLYVAGGSVTTLSGTLLVDPGFGATHTLGLSNSLFVAKIPTATPAQPAFETFLDGVEGGSGTELGTAGLALDSAGDIWVGGHTSYSNTPPPFGLMNPIAFACPSGTPSQPNCATGFVSEASPDGASLLFSTYLGGNSTYPGDAVAAVAADASGDIYAAGTAYSTNFPVTANAYYSTQTYGGAFLAKLAPQPAPTAPTVAINPGSLATSFVGGETTTQIVVTNTAASGPDLVIGNVTYADPSFDYEVYPDIGGPDGNPSCYYYNTNTPDPVPPGGSCDITVYWYPEQLTPTGPDPLTVSIFDNAANILIPQVVRYSPTALNGPQATIAPVTPIGNVLQGSQSVATVTVTDSGNADLTIGTLGLAGSPDFSLGTAASSPCSDGGIVYPRSSCNIAVIYTANGAVNTPESATLTINDNSITPPGSPQLVTLTAATVLPEPQIEVNTGFAGDFITFPEMAEGAPTATVPLQIMNDGPAPLVVGVPTFAGANAGDFHLSGTPCPSLSEFESCSTLGVYFQPSTLGSESATLLIPSNDPVTPVFSVTLNGSGGVPPGPPTSWPLLVSLDNEVPPQPSATGASESALSSTGQYVAFTGSAYSFGAGNLPGPSNPVGAGLYLRNTCNGAASGCTQSTQYIAYGPTSGPEANGGAACDNQQSTITLGATNPQISDDGRFVAFNDDACPLNNTTGSQPEPGPVYLRDTQADGGAGATTVVTDASGNPLMDAFEMSEDARFFAWLTNPTSGGQPEITETDTCQSDGTAACATPQDVLVSQSNNGTPDSSASDLLTAPALSPDGRYVAFASDWDDVNGVAGNGHSQVYLRDTCLGVAAGCTPGTILVSQDASGAPGTGGNSGQPYNIDGQTIGGIAVSSGGRYVVFTSNATNLPQPANGNGTYPQEVYLRDTVAGTTTLLSAAIDGSTPGGNALQPHISDDGRIVTFVDAAALFAGAPGNGYQGAVYSYDTCTSNGTPVSGCTAGLQAVVSEQTLAAGGTEGVTVSDSELAGGGAAVTYTGPPYNCTNCTQVWLNQISAGVPIQQHFLQDAIVTLASLIPSTGAPNPGQAYSYTLLARNTGIVAATDVTLSDSLPAGAVFIGATGGTCTAAGGVVSCDLGPMSAGASATVTITLTAPNSPGATLTDSASVATGAQPNLAVQTALSNTITEAAPPPPPAITTASLPPGVAGAAYPSTVILTSGGTGAVTVSQSSGSLPPGLGLSANTLAGVPTLSGSYSFSLVATDANNTVSSPQSYTVGIACPAISLGAIYAVQVGGQGPSPVPSTLDLTAGALIPVVQFVATLPLGDNLPLTFSENGPLDGLTFNPVTAQLSGTPLGTGSFAFSVSVSGGGCSSAPASYTLVVTPPLAITLPTINETITASDSIGSPNTLISATVLPAIQESVHASDEIASPNTLISAEVLQPIQETVTTSDSLGSPNTLISAVVLPAVQENVVTSDSLNPAPEACALPAGVSVKLGGYLRHFGVPAFYTQAVTLTNTSGSAITGPIYFLLGGLSGAAVTSSGSTDTCATPAGTPYVTLAGGLAAGASAQIVLHFTNVTAIHYTPSVLTGGTP